MRFNRNTAHAIRPFSAHWRAACQLCGLLMLLCWLPHSTAQQADNDAPLRLTYLFSDDNASVTLEAYRQLLDAHPALNGRVELQFVTESLFDDLDVGAIRASDVLVLDMMNQQLLERFDSTHETDLLAEVAARGASVVVGMGLQSPDYFTAMGAVFDPQAHNYWQFGGLANQIELMKYALQQAGVTGLTLAEPQEGLDEGFYYPDGEGGRVFADWDSFVTWRESQGMVADGRPRVAIGFYRAAYYGSEMDVVDAIITEVERQGAYAIPVFGYPGHVAYQQLLLDANGDARADVILSLLLRFADFDAMHTLAELDVPILNLITLYGRSEEDWRAS